MTTQTQLATSAMTRTHAQDLGRFGEDYSCQYLQNMGWSILDRNWRKLRRDAMTRLEIH